ncbi:MAG: acyl-CoA/acyl-ACP dehydrogenase [Leptospiraceae bacterium]|nr:acyl-CoA/acyl-ACP dehydrogenase [Leptospiraceae bacterium]MCP5500435.1 acyl-CoA/acyl-ACP dehydrogenase [Leptospiraceae bacterium]
MDFDFTEEEQEFADGFRHFCTREISPYSESYEEAGEIPKTQFQKLANLGFLGLLHEKKYGGSELGYMKTMIVQEILAEACGSTFFSVGASAGLFGLPISEFGTEAQKGKYLPGIIEGSKIGCLAVTEPDAGSDVMGIKTIARKKNGKYYLSGQKTYITNAPNSDYAVVLAKLEDDGKKIGPTTFIVNTNAKGVSKGKPMKKLGLKASPTGELFFDELELSEDDILGKKGRGFKIIMDAFNRERLSLGAYSVGVMAACIAESRKFSRTRKTFGRPIYKHQSVAYMLADMRVKYEASRNLLYETAWMMDKFGGEKSKDRLIHNGFPVDLTAKTATFKLLSSTLAREVCNLAVQLHGGAGYMEEYKVARLYRDIKIAEIGGGTSEIQKQIIAHSEAKRIKV